MKVTARLDEESIKQILDDLLPLTVILDEDGGGDRWLRIDPARTVDFVADDGLRVEVAGHLHWKTAGVSLPLTIKSAQLMLRPVVVSDDDGGRLVFRPALESMDLKNVPGFVDSGITNLINKRLAGEGDKLAWRFGKTLRATVPVGKDLVEIANFVLSAGAAAVLTLDDAVVLTVDLQMRFTRSDAAPPAGDPRSDHTNLASSTSLPNVMGPAVASPPSPAASRNAGW